MGTSSRFLLVAAAVLPLSACVTASPKAVFDDVRRLVGQRTPATILWSDGGAADEEMRRQIDVLLAKPLGVNDAVQVALLNNRQLQAVYARLGIAQADLVQAGLLPNPVIDASLRFGVNGPGTGAEVTIVQEFLSIIQIPLRRRVAEAGLEAAKLEVTAAVLELAGKVKQAFYRAQGARQMVELTQTVMKAAALAADISRRQHGAGNTTDLSFASEQALYGEARLDVATGEAALVEAREHLSELLGVWGHDTEWETAGRLPEIPPDDPQPNNLETLAVSQRADLAAAREAINAAARSVQLTRLWGFFPWGNIGGNSEREPDDGVWHVGPTVSLTLPVFDQRQAEVARGNAAIRQRIDEYSALAVTIRSEIRRVRARMDAARQRATFYRTVVIPLRRRIVAQTQLEYNAMLTGVFQLLQAKRDEVSAGRAYVEVVADYWMARAELERAVGGALDMPSPPSSEPAVAPAPAAAPQHHHEG